MNARARRIVTSAIDLAEKGGFEAVRLRDVAADADVALGTLYRYFRSKEDLLIAALTLEVEQLEKRMHSRPPVGATPQERLSVFFRTATKGMCRRPRLARAILRAAASGDHELAEKVAAFHTSITNLIAEALRAEGASSNGAGRIEEPEAAATQTEAVETGERVDRIAMLLDHVWFASLVGWAGGLHAQSDVIDQMTTAVEVVLRGAEA